MIAIYSSVLCESGLYTTRVVWCVVFLSTIVCVGVGVEEDVEEGSCAEEIRIDLRVRAQRICTVRAR
jgi:hypothetical protein